MRRKEKRNSGNSAISIILTVLVIFGVVGLLGSIFDISLPDDTNDNVELEPTTVYLVPGPNWASDGSSFGAWCWSNTNLPAAGFVLATDEDDDGVYELNIPGGYTSMLFVDLVPGATNLGVNWENKREQSSDQRVPTDENVYYHAYASEWADHSKMLYTPTLEDITLYCTSLGKTPTLYMFDKTGQKEGQFVQMSYQGIAFQAMVSAGYTHVIFITYGDSDPETTSGWDNIEYQSPDLEIPRDDLIHYDTQSGTWTTYPPPSNDEE